MGVSFIWPSLLLERHASWDYADKSLTEAHNLDKIFECSWGMGSCAGFRPQGHFNVAGQVLINNIPDPMLQPLLDYFLTNYVFGPVIPNRVPPANAPPMFPPQLWNIFQVTIQGGSCTNNICEGWNHSFNLTVGQRHPPFYKAIESI